MYFFEYDKRDIEEFFSKNKNLFFPNGKYYKEDVISAVLNYCQELNVKFEQNDSKRYYLFDEAGLATGLDYEEMKEWEERGYPGSKKFTDEMWEATIDTKHSFEDLVYLRSIILNSVCSIIKQLELFIVLKAQQEYRVKSCKQKGSCQIAEIHCENGKCNG